MKTKNSAERSGTTLRVALMMQELDVDQVAFAKLAGTSRQVVNHWLTGKIKTITHNYALTLEANTDYRAAWITSGKGPAKRDPLITQMGSIMESLSSAD